MSRCTGRLQGATSCAPCSLNSRGIILKARLVRVRIEEAVVRSGTFTLLFGSLVLIAVSALAQEGGPPANAPAATAQADVGLAVCRELLAYAEKKAFQSPAAPAGQVSAPAAPPRVDGQETGTQGGGSVGSNTSTNVSSQEAAPPTAPVSSGAAHEAAASPHASGSAGGGAGDTPGALPEFKLAGGVPLQQVRDTARGGDRQACRDTAQTLRRAGADLPAALIALAAYEPDPAKRQ
jgi:hypothetical protein